MASYLWLRTLVRRWSGSQRRQHLRTRPPLRYRPTLELLESRALPSVTGIRPSFVVDSQPSDIPAHVGHGPDQLRTGYGINAITFSGGAVAGDGSGQTIAIVDAYNDPNIVGDVDSFDQNAYLSAADKSAGTTLYDRYGAASSFFTVYDQNGNMIDPGTETSVQDAPKGSWGIEISLDVEWAHSMAPGAKIDLVECENDVYTGALTAAGLPDVSAVSLSWTASNNGRPTEYSSETSYDSYFVHSGVTFLGATGDYGSPGGYPAYSPNVIAVGGTVLHLNSDGTWNSETAWSGSGGGTSQYETEPTYQTGVQSTGFRTVPDVSMDADPGTGVAVYDSYDHSTQPWVEVGGTSVATPCWAALIAIANQGRAANDLAPLNASGPTQTLTFLYGLPTSDFHDITSGSNGSFTAGPGYDEVTGLGSPVANWLVQDLASAGSISLSPGALPQGQYGAAYSQTIGASGGSGSYSFSIRSGGVPGLLLASGGQLSGTPTVAGSFTFTVLASDLANPGLTGSQQYTITVSPASSLTLSPSSLPFGTIKNGYGPIQFGASGGYGSYTFALQSGSSLPPGLSLSSAGILNGTPTIAGTSSFTIVATDNTQPSLTGSGNYSVTVDPAITVSPTTLSTATLNATYSALLTASGGSGTGYRFSLASGSNLPPGLAINGSAISGTPNTAGTYTFTIVAADNIGATGNRTYTLTVDPPIVINLMTLPTATVGDKYSQQFTTSGGSGSGYTFKASGLPSGLTMNSAGLLSGTPIKAAGSPFNITVTVTDSKKGSASAQFSLTVNPAISITPSTLAVATIDDSYSQQLSSTGGSGSGYGYSLASGSSLPSGLTLSSNGSLSGTPSVSGTFKFTIVSTDSIGAIGSHAYTMTIDPAIALAPSTLPAATVSTKYSEQLQASGGSGTGYKYTATGLPSWLTLSSAGLLGGTPPAGSDGDYTFTVLVTDSKDGSFSEEYDLTVSG